MSTPVSISVLIPSRGRPAGLMRAISTMHSKESGKNAVRYVVGCDLDDPNTISAAMDLWKQGLPVLPSIGPRCPSLGAIVNRLSAKHPADVYVPLGDDIEVLTDGWDEKIAEAWRAQDDGLWWWCAENGATLVIMSEKWRAVTGRMYTDYFPFWYDDLWLIEVQRYATGRVCDRLDVWVADNGRGTSHRMRDLSFWDNFFWSLRDERKAEARKIIESLGWPPVEDMDALSLKKNPDFDMDALEAKQGDRNPVTPEYLVALDRAKAIFQQKDAA